MTFIDKYSAFSKWFYSIALGLTVPFYVLLNATSGHPLDPPFGDIVWMVIVVFAAVVAVIFFTTKQRSTNSLKILFTVTLLATTFGGLKICWSLVQFDFDNDSNLLVRSVAYLVPAIFILSCVVIFIGLFRKAD